ncbi:unnamed protein product, partial [Amoebophrya sp. A25]|eukprot:GSA25T00022674001.1
MKLYLNEQHYKDVEVVVDVKDKHAVSSLEESGTTRKIRHQENRVNFAVGGDVAEQILLSPSRSTSGSSAATSRHSDRTVRKGNRGNAE